MSEMPTGALRNLSREPRAGVPALPADASVNSQMSMNSESFSVLTESKKARFLLTAPTNQSKPRLPACQLGSVPKHEPPGC